MKCASVNVDLTVVFVIINNIRMMTNKCRCECKESIDKGVCDKGFIWNPSNCECECYKYVILVSIESIKIVSAKNV